MHIMPTVENKSPGCQAYRINGSIWDAPREKDAMQNMGWIGLSLYTAAYIGGRSME